MKWKTKRLLSVLCSLLMTVNVMFPSASIALAETAEPEEIVEDYENFDAAEEAEETTDEEEHIQTQSEETAEEDPEADMDYEAWGGKYDLQYLLGHYQLVVTKGDARLAHTMGTILVNGDVENGDSFADIYRYQEKYQENLMPTGPSLGTAAPSVKMKGGELKGTITPLNHDLEARRLSFGLFYGDRKLAETSNDAQGNLSFGRLDEDLIRDIAKNPDKYYVQYTGSTSGKTYRIAGRTYIEVDDLLVDFTPVPITAEIKEGETSSDPEPEPDDETESYFPYQIGTSYIAGYLSGGQYCGRAEESTNVAPLYLGSVNEIKQEYDRYYFNGSVVGFPRTKAFSTDSFIDWQRLQEAVDTGSKQLAENPDAIDLTNFLKTGEEAPAEVQLNGNQFVITLQAGKTYNLDLMALKEKYPKWSTISIVGEEAAEINHLTTVINITSSGEVMMDELGVNSHHDGIIEHNPSGTSIIWNFPSASSVILPVANWVGHVVVPGGPVHQETGNFSGCIISGSRSLNTTNAQRMRSGTAGGYTSGTAEGHFNPMPQSPRPTTPGQTEPSEAMMGFFGFNSLQPQGQLDLKGRKVLEASELDTEVPELKAGEFTFALEETRTNAENRVTQTVQNGSPEAEIKNTADILFETIPYTLKDVGDHTYEIREVSEPDSDPHTEYDTSTKTVIVRVSVNEDAASEAEAAELKVEVAGGEPDLTFTNRKKFVVQTEFEVAKTLSGQDLKADQFTFHLHEVKDGVVSDKPIATAKNKADGKVVFEDIILEDAKLGDTFEYEIHEEAGDGKEISASNRTVNGITYDDHKIRVRVDVIRNNLETIRKENGVLYLKAAPEYLDKKLTFGNTYSENGKAEVTISGTKILENAELKEGQFTFLLQQQEIENAPVIEVKNDARGGFSFPALKYTADVLDGETEKDFIYTVKEKVPENTEGIVYDPASFRVIVQVKKNAEGKLEASLREPNGDIHFSNTYEAKGSFTISGLKILEGAELKEKAYTFGLYEGDRRIATVQNDAKGNFTFPKLSYTLAALNKKESAEFTYTVKEEIPQDAVKVTEDGKTSYIKDGVIYDSAIRTVKVQVKHEGKGVLSAKAIDSQAKVAFTNKTVRFEVEKQDQNGEALKGAVFQVVTLQDEKEVEVAKWTSTEQTYELGSALEPGKTYTLKETESPLGYGKTDPVTFKVKGDGTIEMIGEFSKDQYTWSDGKLTVKNAAISLQVDKTDMDKKSLAGAKISLFDADGKELASWDSKVDETHDFGQLLKTGQDYIIREVSAPEGYAANADIKLHVEENGKITITSPASQGEYIYDEATGRLTFTDILLGSLPQKPVDFHFTVNKTDLNGVELEGALLEIFDQNGVKVASWTSKIGESHDFGPKLENAKYYTLRETSAPEGYETITDIRFRIDRSWKIQIDRTETNGEFSFNPETNTLIVTDKPIEDYVKPIRLVVNKTDMDGLELDDALITIYNKDGYKVASWKSKIKETHDFGPDLKPGEEYTLKEVSAPEGYETITDIRFKVNEDRTITIISQKTDGEYTFDEKTGELIITDRKKEPSKTPDVPKTPDTTIIFKVKKTDTSGNDLAGAVLEVRDENNQTVDKWTSKKNETHDFGPKLKLNATYTLVETSAPSGYEVISSIRFKVGTDGSIEILTRNPNNEFVWDKTKGLLTVRDRKKTTISKSDDEPISASSDKDTISRSSNTTTETNTTTTTRSASTGTATNMTAYAGVAAAALGAAWILLRKERSGRGSDRKRD